MCLVGFAGAQIVGDSTLSYLPMTRVRPFSNLQISDYFVVDGATVNIEFGYQPGNDVLLLDYQGAFGLTSTFSNGVLYITGEAPVSEYSAAISTVIFVTTADDGQSRRITWTYGKNTFRMTLTGHYYTFTKYPGAWSAAVTSCQTTKYMNMQGYLANIDSADEMAEVGGATQYSVWVGGTDLDPTTGTWVWATGPAAGNQFWQGASMYQGGVPVNNSFTKWYRFQPENGDAGQPATTHLSILASLLPNSAYWDDSTDSEGVAGYVCEYGGMDSDAIAQTMNNYAGTVVLAYDCSLYGSDRTTCQNHAAFGCSFNGLACVQRDCSRHLTEGGCNQDWKCSWSTSGFIGTCGNTRCGQYSDGPTCAIDPTCSPQTVGGSAQCLNMQCSLATSPSQCTGVDGCSWIQGQCASDLTANCNGQDVVFMLDGSAALSSEWSRFTTGFQGLTDLFIQAQLTLAAIPTGFGQRVGFLQYGPVTLQTTRDQVPPSTTGSGGTLTGSAASVLADLQYQQARYSVAVGRTISAALPTAQGMFAASAAGRKKILVIFAAGTIDDAAGAANSAVLSQLKASGVTILGAAIRPNAQPSNGGTNAMNSLLLLTPNVIQVSINDVLSQVIYGMCNKNTTFGNTIFGSSPYPQQLCVNYPTQLQCVANPVCAWDRASLTCRVTSCMLHTSAQGCNAAATTTCVWDATLSLCKQKCATFLSASTCAGSCFWSGSQCLDMPCVGSPTEDACIADPNSCIYTPGTVARPQDAKCTPPVCQALTNNGSTVCVTSPANCAWVNSKECVPNTCGLIMNSNLCAQNPLCTFDNASNACTFNQCGVNQNEVDCSKTTMCRWSVDSAPGACVPAPCTKYNLNPNTAQSNCATDPACVWGGDQLRCMVQDCVSFTTAGNCSKLSKCVWRNNQCKDSRYVQCPAIDAVFLVEGTQAMQQAFGRHPNGFYGVIEQLRQWSNAAPFANDVNATGFRMKLFMYGANTAPAYPTTGFYPQTSNGQITPGQTSWTGAGGQLYAAEAAADQYALGTAGNVKIRSALVAAKNLFTADNVTGRIRMVIILGHSAITDAGAELGTAIEDLEAGGVQIFSNVIRRFSSVTPNEQRSALYLQPLASDPQESHFSFTTIDVLRSDFLDTFCDPTSTTGQILGISRDKTLPCNWLNGRTECEVQGSCAWNASASVECPLPKQCPNMGCVELPPALAKIYKCQNCKYSGGAFTCDGGNYPAKVGLCQTSPCMRLSQAACTGACVWNADKERCDRAQCSYSTAASCNQDLACVWVDAGLPESTFTGCRPSVCGQYRSGITCNAPSTDQNGGVAYKTCDWMTDISPAICTESRCPNLNSSNCNLNPATCGFQAAVGGRQCLPLTCEYTDSALCAADGNCFWNPYDTNGKFCQERTGVCVMSGYSQYSQCTATCGPAVRYKARTIVAFPVATSSTCAEVAQRDGSTTDTCSKISNCQAGDTTIVVAQACDTDGLSCSAHCGTYGSDIVSCTKDVSCVWKNRQCLPAPVYGCGPITDAATCNAADSCMWNVQTSFCDDVVKSCQNASTQSLCNQQNLNCFWHTGATSNGIATASGIPSQLVNPGQKEIFVFPTLRISSSDVLWGAAVTIEANYSRGHDLLELTYPSPINATWNAASGTLFLSGQATVTEYADAIRFVTFFTTSSNPDPRMITWSFRKNTVYSQTTGAWYTAFNQAGVSWDTAKLNCANDNFYGLTGFLTTVQSDHENTVISSKLGAAGWISGDDTSRSQWRYSTGSAAGVAFWTGPSSVLGGYLNAGGFANWAPGQPNVVSSQGFNHPYMNISGMWSAQPGDYSAGVGYVCKYQGQPAGAYRIGGATIIGVGGCMPNMCTFHVNQSDCARDAECAWIRGACKQGCSSLSTQSECLRSADCQWDSSVVPPVCDINPCVGLGQTACSAISYACLWTAGQGCQYRTGCAIYTAQANCSAVPSCEWTSATATCDTRPCESFTSQVACLQNALCQWNGALKVCSSAICQYGSQSECSNDRRCTWSQTNGIGAPFPPGGSSILPFTTQVPLTFDTNTLIDGMTVAITEGFQIGQDMLTVLPADNIAGNYKISYNKLTGVLTLIVVPGVGINRFQGFSFIQTAVRFYSTSNNLVRRRLTYVLGLRMALSSTKSTVFKYIPTTTPLTSFSSASAACAAWGQQFGYASGSVARIMNQIDNLRLEALSAQGWLAAAVASGTDSQWQWLATPLYSASLGFWTGISARGMPVPMAGQSNTTMYAQWAGGEPTRGFSNSYAFFAQTGFWKVVNESSSNLQTGVVCQYAVPTNVSVYGERNVQPSGCYLTPCLSFPKAQCLASPQCLWTETSTSGQCAQDTWCTKAGDPDTCNLYELCYWDYNLGGCRTAPPNTCSLSNHTGCIRNSKCSWSTQMVPRNPSAPGVCAFYGCGAHPVESACSADPTCRWSASSDGLSGVCVARLCGYQSETQCWTDRQCQWNRLSSKCSRSICLDNTASQCSVADSCAWDSVNQICNYVRCGTTQTGIMGKLTCQSDSACLWNPTSGTCTMPNCATLFTQASCVANSLCYFTFQPNRCLAAQCTSNTNVKDCEQDETVLSRKPCLWVPATGKCRELTYAEQNAPVSVPGTCVQQSWGNLWWLWTLAALCLVLILGIFYRLYLAYSKGLSFFEPARKTKQFSPHAQFGDELFEEAQQVGQETNINTKYTRPTADEL